MNRVAIVSAKRSPIGSFMGVLSNLSSVQIASQVAKDCIEKSNLDSNVVEEIFMGSVLQTGLGQSPARQVSINTGLLSSTVSTTVNKVCASGMKAFMFGAQSIQLGIRDTVMVGGMESMSNAPHYTHIRKSTKLGNNTLIDSIMHDGLKDAYENIPMGEFAERIAKKDNISRQEQDEFAIQSYEKTTTAWKNNLFENEITPISIESRAGKSIVTEDEEYKKNLKDKASTLPTIFKKENGTVTAYNSSKINDGASVLLLMSEERCKNLGIKPLAYLLSTADAALEPEWFTIAPEQAIKNALLSAKMKMEQIDLYEINEAFSVVVLSNINRLGVFREKVNINGGAIAMGHPLGNSGARIIVTLINNLINKGKKYGMASICNGGGGASAVIVENANL